MWTCFISRERKGRSNIMSYTTNGYFTSDICTAMEGGRWDWREKQTRKRADSTQLRQQRKWWSWRWIVCRHVVYFMYLASPHVIPISTHRPPQQVSLSTYNKSRTNEKGNQNRKTCNVPLADYYYYCVCVCGFSSFCWIEFTFAYVFSGYVHTYLCIRN